MNDLAMNEGGNGEPLGVSDLGEDAGLDPLANAGARKRFNGGSLILIGVIVLALGGLWAMRSLSRVSAGSSANRDIEATIDKFLKNYKPEEPKTGVSPDAGALAVLSDSYVDRQVPLNDVQRNPFFLPSDFKLDPVIIDKGLPIERQREEKTKLIEKAAARLELKSVIMSDDPIASISGKIVHKGAELVVDPEKVVFRVTEITADSVTVVAEDEALELVVPITIAIKRDLDG
jgi:hypothetical protein